MVAVAIKIVLRFRTLFFVLFAFYQFSCTQGQSSCFYAVDLNESRIKKNPHRGPVRFGIRGKKTLKRIVNENITGDLYKSNIKNLFIVRNQDTLDSFEEIILIEKSQEMSLRLPTGRYRWEFKDSIAAMSQIRKEHLVLKLYNGEIIKLNYCDK